MRWGSVLARIRARGTVGRSERGASAVELALVLTLLVFFLFGTIQFGIAYNRYQGLQAAAREGARIAAIGGSEADIRTRVRQAQSLFNAGHVRVKVEYSDNNGTSWKGPPICDDASGSNQCSATAPPAPCTVAGIGNLVRVTATVPGSQSEYDIVIPLWGNQSITYESHGAFRCER